MSEPNRDENIVAKTDRQFNTGNTVRVCTNHSYDNFNKGDVGIIQSCMWDWPNWEYTVKFPFGERRVWDYQLERI